MLDNKMVLISVSAHDDLSDTKYLAQDGLNYKFDLNVAGDILIFF